MNRGQHGALLWAFGVLFIIAGLCLAASQG
jgi:hypothetical protein